jgi:hypothetical protein
MTIYTASARGREKGFQTHRVVNVVALSHLLSFVALCEQHYVDPGTSNWRGSVDVGWIGCRIVEGGGTARPTNRPGPTECGVQ